MATQSSEPMPWDGLFDNFYPSKKTSIKRYRVKLSALQELNS